MKKEEIKSLDDMAQYFFQIAKEIGHPLKDINLELHKTFAETKKEDDWGKEIKKGLY